MKYIIGKYFSDGPELPVMFPGSINHSDMASSVFPDGEIVSAGTIKYDDCISGDNYKMYCCGDSFTLRSSSRKEDIFLIRAMLRA